MQVAMVVPAEPMGAICAAAAEVERAYGHTGTAPAVRLARHASSGA